VAKTNNKYTIISTATAQSSLTLNAKTNLKLKTVNKLLLTKETEADIK